MATASSEAAETRVVTLILYSGVRAKIKLDILGGAG